MKDAILNKPKAKPLAFRASAPKVQKRKEVKKALDQWEQDYIDYDLGDMVYAAACEPVAK